MASLEIISLDKLLERYPKIGEWLNERKEVLRIHDGLLLPSVQDRIELMGGERVVRETIAEYRSGNRLPFLFDGCRFIPNTPGGVGEVAQQLQFRLTPRFVGKIIYDNIRNPNNSYDETFRSVDVKNIAPVWHKKGLWALTPSSGFLTVAR